MKSLYLKEKSNHILIITTSRKTFSVYTEIKYTLEILKIKLKLRDVFLNVYMNLKVLKIWEKVRKSDRYDRI